MAPFLAMLNDHGGSSWPSSRAGTAVIFLLLRDYRSDEFLNAS
jgi:hypothetical protein